MIRPDLSSEQVKRIVDECNTHVDLPGTHLEKSEIRRAYLRSEGIDRHVLYQLAAREGLALKKFHTFRGNGVKTAAGRWRPGRKPKPPHKPHKKRGNYVRDEAFRKKVSERSKAAWARVKEEEKGVVGHSNANGKTASDVVAKLEKDLEFVNGMIAQLRDILAVPR